MKCMYIYPSWIPPDAYQVYRNYGRNMLHVVSAKGCRINIAGEVKGHNVTITISAEQTEVKLRCRLDRNGYEACK